MKKILVPVDFSSHADINSEYAVEFARNFPSEILLYHTYFDQIMIADSSFPDTVDINTMYNEELMKEILHQSEKKLAEMEQRLRSRIEKGRIEGVSVRSEVTGGVIESELRDICAEYQPDLVVIGNKTDGKNKSVSARISTYLVNHLPNPVMLIPEIKEFLGFTNIMVGVDLDEGNKPLIKKIFSLFEDVRARLWCVHFITRKNTKEEKEKFLNLKEQFAGPEFSSRINFEMVEIGEDNQKAIDAYVKEHDIRLIAFQPHKRSMLYNLFTSNITKKNLYATNIPLLAVPVMID